MKIERQGRVLLGRRLRGIAASSLPVSGCLLRGRLATTEDGAIAGVGDPGAQAVQALANIAAALEKVGATLADVVRTRMYATDIYALEDVARAHGEAFGEHRPVTTMVQVAALIDPRMLVEIEAEAVVGAA